MSTDANSGDSTRGPRPPKPEEWRDIAAKASREKDPLKLIKLVETLCDKLDEESELRKRKQPQKTVRTPHPKSNSSQNFG
jgi:hypothetical protein